jgi:hypothetical protein
VASRGAGNRQGGEDGGELHGVMGKLIQVKDKLIEVKDELSGWG